MVATDFLQIRRTGLRLTSKKGKNKEQELINFLPTLHTQVFNEIKVSGNLSTQFRVPVVKQQSFHASLFMTSSLK
jgi:hypothetical protein